MRTLAKIPLSKIDQTDKNFMITFIPTLAPLLNSIQMAGLLDPLILRERGDSKYQIVCGFKRAEALRQLAITEAQAVVYHEGDLDNLQALLLNIGHNLTRPLNLVEKAQILEKLLAFGVTEKEVIDRYLPLLGLQPNARILKQVTSLLELKQGLREYIVRQNLTLSTSVLFTLLDKEAQGAILPLLEALRPGENRVKEMISFLREISLRDGVSVSSVLAEEKLGKILDDPDTPRPQRIERLRKILKEMRFPRLTAMEEKFAQYKRSLSLPPHITFHPPPLFEGEEFRMELRFKDFRAFRELVTKLHQIAEDENKDRDPLRELGHGR
jgi:ParB-like chromosome segregation protein Spo0J